MTDALRKNDIQAFILDDVMPLLDDQDWHLYQRDTLMKVRDEVIYGLCFERSRFGPFFTVRVHIRPLYWPPKFYAFGLMDQFDRWLDGHGSWLELNGPTERKEVARRVSRTLNRSVIPFFEAVPDSASILRYHNRHAWGPMLAWGRSVLGYLYSPWGPLGYLSAWCGSSLQARFYLWQELRDLRGSESAVVPEWREHARQTLRLLKRPTELRRFLEETASEVRQTLRLDRARPVSEILAHRARRRPME